MRVIQFILGFSIGLTLFIGGVAGIGYYFLKDMLQSPSKPTFAEEKLKEIPKATSQKTTTQKNSKTVSTPTPTEEAEEKLPQGAYKATVTWTDGLSVRSEPSIESDRVGGVAYNKELIVLQTSEDGKWQKVRTVGGDVEGWIKAGNTKKSTSEE
jgi:uncharacterized protein YgiM (DUF1202 family)